MEIKDNQPSHVKTFEEIMDEECEKGEEVTWRPFKENLRLRFVKTRTATMAKDGIAIGHTRPDSPLSWNLPVRFRRRDDEHGKKVTGMIQQRSPLAKEKPMKRSLMALLADDEEEEDGDDDCCKFMVQNQDAAAIPCGHTFCHHYPRELWASHENCPHCSSFIMEILDVF